MAKASGSPAHTVQRRAVETLFWCALALGSIAHPALAQTTVTPGSTINGTVPRSEGNRWNGLDHQPTPSETIPIQNSHQQAKVNHKLSKLDQQLLNYKLPKLPLALLRLTATKFYAAKLFADAPSVRENAEMH